MTKQHEVTKANQNAVVMLAMTKVPQKEIAALLEINQDTLRKYYRKELDEGKTRLVATVYGKWVEMAQDGKHPQQTERFLEVHGAIPEKGSKIELTGANGGPLQIESIQMMRAELIAQFEEIEKRKDAIPIGTGESQPYSGSN